MHGVMSTLAVATMALSESRFHESISEMGLPSSLLGVARQVRGVLRYWSECYDVHTPSRHNSTLRIEI